MIGIYNKRTEFLLNLWRRVREKPLYKAWFVLFTGAWGAAVGGFFSILLLWGYESKWILTLIGTGFLTGVSLSYFQYRYWNNKYNQITRNS